MKEAYFIKKSHINTFLVRWLWLKLCRYSQCKQRQNGYFKVIYLKMLQIFVLFKSTLFIQDFSRITILTFNLHIIKIIYIYILQSGRKCCVFPAKPTYYGTVSLRFIQFFLFQFTKFRCSFCLYAETKFRSIDMQTIIKEIVRKYTRSY